MKHPKILPMIMVCKLVRNIKPRIPSARRPKIIHPSNVDNSPAAKGLDLVLSTLASISLSKISFITHPMDLTKMLPIKITNRTLAFEAISVEIIAAANAGQRIKYIPIGLSNLQSEIKPLKILFNEEDLPDRHWITTNIKRSHSAPIGFRCSFKFCKEYISFNKFFTSKN